VFVHAREGARDWAGANLRARDRFKRNRTLEWKRCASFDLVMTKGDRYPGAGLVF
jgi:hypothetical protein